MMAIRNIAKRPVIGGQELRIYKVADHLEVASAQQCGCHEIADRQNEDKNKSSRNARHGHRQDHAAERDPTAATQITRGLGNFGVQA